MCARIKRWKRCGRRLLMLFEILFLYCCWWCDTPPSLSSISDDDSIQVLFFLATMIDDDDDNYYYMSTISASTTTTTTHTTTDVDVGWYDKYELIVVTLESNILITTTTPATRACCSYCWVSLLLRWTDTTTCQILNGDAEHTNSKVIASSRMTSED